MSNSRVHCLLQLFHLFFSSKNASIENWILHISFTILDDRFVSIYLMFLFLIEMRFLSLRKFFHSSEAQMRTTEAKKSNEEWKTEISVRWRIIWSYLSTCERWMTQSILISRYSSLLCLAHRVCALLWSILVCFLFSIPIPFIHTYSVQSFYFFFSLNIINEHELCVILHIKMFFA